MLLPQTRLRMLVAAHSRLTRSLAVVESDIYRIDPCQSSKEPRNR